MPSRNNNNNINPLPVKSLTSTITDFGDRFHVFKFLGQGSGGPVSAAYDNQHPSLLVSAAGNNNNNVDAKNNRDPRTAVALKRISKGNAHKEFALLLQMQNHPNIVKAYELVDMNAIISSTSADGSSTDQMGMNIKKMNSKNSSSRDANIMVMEYASLGSASKVAVALGGNKMNASIAQREWYAKKVTRDMLKALQHLHRHNVVHRDVKASNCLLFDDTPLPAPPRPKAQEPIQQKQQEKQEKQQEKQQEESKTKNDSSPSALDHSGGNLGDTTGAHEKYSPKEGGSCGSGADDENNTSTENKKSRSPSLLETTTTTLSGSAAGAGGTESRHEATSDKMNETKTEDQKQQLGQIEEATASSAATQQKHQDPEVIPPPPPSTSDDAKNNIAQQNKDISNDNNDNDNPQQPQPQFEPAESILLHNTPFTAKLSDFGLATRVQETDPEILLKSRKNRQTAHSDDVAGSVYWMSPESLQGLVAPCCDVWALGCFAYELINSGRPPLNDREWGNAMYVVLSCQDEKRPSLIPTLMKFARDKIEQIRREQRQQNNNNNNNNNSKTNKNNNNNNDDDEGDDNGDQRKNEKNLQQQLDACNFLEQISPSCLDFLTKALTIDPTKRPTASELLQHEWIKDSTSSTSSMPPPPPPSNPLEQIPENENNNNNNSNNQKNKKLPLSNNTDPNATRAFALERLIQACSQGIPSANRSWLWLPKSQSLEINNNSNNSGGPLATPRGGGGGGAAASSNSGANNATNNLENSFNGSVASNSMSQMFEPIQDVSNMTFAQRMQIKERVREMQERLCRTSELVRENVLSATSPFAEQKNLPYTLTHFEAWLEIVPPSIDVTAMTTSYLQANFSYSDSCQQAQILISRVVWVLSSLFLEGNYNNNNNNNNINGRIINNNNNYNFNGFYNNNSNNSFGSPLDDTEAVVTRHNLISDLAECGFWTTSRGLDWGLLFPAVTAITRTNPSTFAEVEGRSRYIELCRDVARGIFTLFEASCNHSDIRFLKACVRSPHTIRYLFSHQVTRRDTALCLCYAMQRLGEIPYPIAGASASQSPTYSPTNGSIIKDDEIKNKKSSSSSSTRKNKKSRSANNQQQQQQPSARSASSNGDEKNKTKNNNNNNNLSDADKLFSPDRHTRHAMQPSLGGAVAGAAASSSGKHNNNNNNALRKAGSASNLASAVFYDEFSGFGVHESNASTNNNNNHHPGIQPQHQTGPHQIVLTTQALRSFLPHFLDEAALAVANDAGSDADHYTFDIVCEAFLRVTDGSELLLTHIVSSLVFLRKLSVGLPPNRVANHAVAILTRYAAHTENIDELLRLMPFPSWLTLASSIDVSYARCAEVMEVIARLRHVPHVAESLVKQNPVVAYVLSRPVDQHPAHHHHLLNGGGIGGGSNGGIGGGGAGGGGGFDNFSRGGGLGGGNSASEATTRLMRALRLLASEPAVGASYSASLSIRDGVMLRLREAASHKNYSEACAAIELLGVLFTFSPNPDVYTNCDELVRLLLKFVKAPMNPQNREVIKCASRLFNSIVAVASL